MSTATPTITVGHWVAAPDLKTFSPDGTIRYRWRAALAAQASTAAVRGPFRFRELAELKARQLTEANEPFPEARR